MPEKYTHFVADEPEQQQQYTNFVPDEGLTPIGTDKAGFPHYQGTPDSRNGLQKVFDESTKEGLDGALVRGLFAPVMHPVQTAGAIAKTFTSPRETANEVIQSAKEKPGETFFNFAGGVLGSAGLGGLADKSITGVPPMAKSLSERFGGYESPVIPKPLQNASAAAKAIRPVGGIAPDFEQTLATNLPRIKAFAEETGNPLHSQWETAEAARQLANKGLTHYKTNFLDPYANEQISMRSVPEYQGAVTGEGRMTTLAQLEKRISDINDMQRAAQRTAKTTGAQMSAEQALGLENEASKLRDILYREIGKRTGVEPELIRDLRQSYGQQFNIADTIDAARRARLGRTGAIEEAGAQTPVSKSGIIDRTLDTLRGGQEYIANAKLRRAMRPFEPQKVEYPLAKTPSGGGTR